MYIYVQNPHSIATVIAVCTHMHARAHTHKYHCLKL